MLGLAAAAYALPLSRGGGRAARAGSPAIPRRIVFFYTEQGTMKPLWRPTAPGAPDPLTITAPWSTSDHVLGPLHAPLEPWKKQMLLLDGLDMVSSFVDPSGGDAGHVSGTGHALTGAFAKSTDPYLAGGPSIDQFIASSINSPAPVTPVPSLELFLGIDARGGDAGGSEHTPLYAGPGLPVPIRGDVGAVYDRLFPGGPRPTSPEEQAKFARALAEKKAALGFASQSFASNAAKLGKADRERLSAHAAALGDLTNRLALTNATACTEPTRADAVQGTMVGDYTKNADAMMRLIQTAFACDLTRVATLYFVEPPGDAFGFTSVGGAAGIHEVIHRVVGGGGAAPDLATDPAAIKVCMDYYLYHARLYAQLVSYLAAIPEADGSTLLDHTLVVWCGQLGSGDHSHGYLPYVLTGGMGGAVTQGRYVRYPRTRDNDRYLDNGTRGPAHNDLYVSLANMMGVQTSTFGEPTVCKGPLAGLK